MIPLVSDAVRHEGGLVKLIVKSMRVFQRLGVQGIRARIRHLVIQRKIRSLARASEDAHAVYRLWLEQEALRSDPAIAAKVISLLPRQPKISILLPTYEPDIQFLREAVSSVCDQVYGNWELCIADDASREVDVSAFVTAIDDERICFIERAENGNISAATNSALGLANGDYVTFLDQDDVLDPMALFWIVEALNRNPDARLLYSDEDKLGEDGLRCEAFFKPDWNYDYLLAHNYVCHLMVIERGLVESHQGFRVGFEGAQDHDLVLRVTEQLQGNEIVHVPRILYHWRRHAASTASNVDVKPRALRAGEQAIAQHLERSGVDAAVIVADQKYRVRYRATSPEPAVTIVIPTRDFVADLRVCVESIWRKTTYGNFRILIVDNGSVEPETHEYLHRLASERSDVDVVRDDRPFNFSALVNLGVAAARSEYVCLLNNDTEVIAGDWLSVMVGNLQRTDVGIVGAKLLYSDDTVQHAGVILGIGGVAGHAHKYFPSDSLGYYNRLSEQHQLSAVTAACLLTKKSVFDDVDGFDEQIAVAFNDVDFCLRVGEAGYKIVWAPDALLYHHESKSRGDETTPAKQARFSAEVRLMLARWGEKLTDDPAYNPNLTLIHENFAMAEESRNQTIAEVYEFHRQRRRLGRLRK